MSIQLSVNLLQLQLHHIHRNLEIVCKIMMIFNSLCLIFHIKLNIGNRKNKEEDRKKSNKIMQKKLFKNRIIMEI